jgi:hypothetical protein
MKFSEGKEKAKILHDVIKQKESNSWAASKITQSSDQMPLHASSSLTTL